MGDRRLCRQAGQAEAGDEVDPVRRAIAARIMENERCSSSPCRPKTLSPILISRYRSGRQYGTHVDDELMRGMRTDVSFSLFLAGEANREWDFTSWHSSRNP